MRPDGEAIRPAQGYPNRLLLPGWEGNTNVKWLRRIEVGDQPFMTREETSKYSEPIRGLAWSGRGRIIKVEVSTDGGRNWQNAQLAGPVLPKAHARFTLPWQWKGGQPNCRVARLMRPATSSLRHARSSMCVVPGALSYHLNPIVSWIVENDGRGLYKAEAWG